MFEVGKWYKDTKHPRALFIKFYKHKNEAGWILSSERIIETKHEFRSNDTWCLDSRNWVPVDISEIQSFLPESHPDNKLSKDELLAEAKRRYKIGDTIISTYGPNNKKITLTNNNFKYEKLSHLDCDVIWTGEGTGFLWDTKNGIPKWAEIISKSEESIWKHLLTECDRQRLKDGTFKISTKEAFDAQNSKSSKAIKEFKVGDWVVVEKFIDFDTLGRKKYEIGECFQIQSIEISLHAKIKQWACKEKDAQINILSLREALPHEIPNFTSDLQIAAKSYNIVDYGTAGEQQVTPLWKEVFEPINQEYKVGNRVLTHRGAGTITEYDPFANCKYRIQHDQIGGGYSYWYKTHEIESLGELSKYDNPHKPKLVKIQEEKIVATNLPIVPKLVNF